MKRFAPKALVVAVLMFAAALMFTNCTLFKKDFVIISGSENESLEPMLRKFGRKNGVNIQMHYKGSVDIMLELQRGTIDADAVWPANSLWITLGDESRKVKHLKSIMTSPVVFGIRKEKAEELGFTDKKVYVKDILQAIKSDKLRFMMTSATQSNSGASGYLGFLYALAGNPEVLTTEHLDSPELRSTIAELLAGINRSSGSSGWLKELFLKGSDGEYDAMVNYESMIIEANQHLVESGEGPLWCVYPEDGIVLSDSPLGYVNRGDDSKEEIFLKLQKYLLSDNVQEEILAAGRRTGFGGIGGDAPKAVFNKEWGIDYDRILSPIKLPPAKTIEYALSLYQTELRKPSFTVFCLDFSGSMSGDGETQLKEALGLLFNQETAQTYMINAGAKDITVIYAFSDEIKAYWVVEGNDPAKWQEALSEIENYAPGGYTDIYSPVIAGFMMAQKVDMNMYQPAVILMTDGESNDGRNFSDVESFLADAGGDFDVPVFSIMFGDASEDQLEELAERTRARVFDGRKDLIKAFRKAKGYN